MAVAQAQGLLDACNLPPAWQGSASWRILDTDFGDGQAFLASWQAWVLDPHRPPLLHYVAIAAAAPERATVLRQLAAFPALAQYSTVLERAWFGLLPGFHRIVLHQAQVLLTLCIGPLQTMLREQRFLADSLYLRAGLPNPGWDLWSVKALARLCRRGTQLALEPAAPQLRRDLAHAGFVVDLSPRGDAGPDMGAASTDILSAHYGPHWQPGSSRDRWRTQPQPASSCVVVGAGLAGATVAAALARRGWQVTVLDRAAQPAAAASGLPVGLLVPQVSRDDNARSRLSRAGARATLQLCQGLLREGEDWAWSGVLELRADGGSSLPENWPVEGRQWSASSTLDASQAAWSHGLADSTDALWHAGAAWIKPARLVQACLALAGVRFIGSSAVHRIVRGAGMWQLQDPTGMVLARAPLLVLAGAGDSVRLLESARSAEHPTQAPLRRLTTMHGVEGQVSWAMQQDGDGQAFAPFPVNGLGSFVANVPMPDGPAWFAGATYETGAPVADQEAQSHRENRDRLALLLPAAGQHLSGRFGEATLRAWRGQRCTTADRLPAVGPLRSGPQPDIWVSTGMGSRGLTYAPLCAELLAAQLGGEPLPLPASLLRSLDATRARLLHHV